jgi:DNA-binding NarL/FixJ family response regulator
VANPNLAGVPKAILSSFMQPQEVEKMLKLGVSCFIPKPASLQEFLRDIGARINSLLKDRIPR